MVSLMRGLRRGSYRKISIRFLRILVFNRGWRFFYRCCLWGFFRYFLVLFCFGIDLGFYLVGMIKNCILNEFYFFGEEWLGYVFICIIELRTEFVNSFLVEKLKVIGIGFVVFFF